MLELQTSKCFSDALFPSGIWPPKGRSLKGEGGGGHLEAVPGYSFICVWALGGEEKAGFGAQPRDFDTILPCPGNISNNIKGFGASSFKMLLRNPIPQLILASGSPWGPRTPKVKGGGLTFEKSPGYSFIGVWPP